MRPRRPINADLPPADEAAQAGPPDAAAADQDEAVEAAGTAHEAAPPAPGGAPEAASKPEAEPRAGREKAAQAAPIGPRRRTRISATPAVLGGLAVLAVALIVVAVVVGGSGGATSQTSAPGPAPAAPEKAASGGAHPSQTAERLGYPSFATDNTTRIGGSGAAANAAAVALAVFPSRAPSQRPAAVTLVSEEDWAGAIAASVLMAPPVRAPVLFSGAESLPEASAEALAALRPAGGAATGGAALFAIGSVALPTSPGRVTRVDSGDPASTAAQIATLRDRLFGAPAKALVIAPGFRPDLAMPAAAWAARSGDPVLYAEAKRLPQPTAAALRRDPRARIYVLGPPSAIGPKVMGQIAKIDRRVRRVSGKDAVATALALARFHDGSFGWNVNDPGHGFVLARSDAPLEAAAAAALSAAGTWGPLLLTDNPDTLPAEVRSYFLDVKPGYTTDPTRAFYNHVWVVGDQEAIGVDEQAEVNQLAELAKIGGGE